MVLPAFSLVLLWIAFYRSGRRRPSGRGRCTRAGKLDVFGRSGGGSSEEIRRNFGVDFPVGENEYMPLLQLVGQVNRPHDARQLVIGADPRLDENPVRDVGDD